MPTKLIRFGIIVVLTAGISWFGVTYGPKSNDVQARVYEQFLGLSENMPAYLFESSESSKPRKVIVNNNTTWLRVTRTENAIRDVLEFYERQYPSVEFASIITALGGKPLFGEESRVFLEKVPSYAALSRFQHTYVLRERFGFWGGVMLKDSFEAVDNEGKLPLLQQALVSGHVGKITTGRVVIALKMGDQKKVTVLNLWTDHDFNIYNFNPGPDGDMPGFDIDNVPRYKGAKRLLSIEQDNRSGRFRLVQYRGTGRIGHVVAFLKAEMESRGWRQMDSVDGFDLTSRNGTSLFFTDNDRDCSLFITQEPGSESVMATVIENRQHIKERS
ncbi:MAG: hypothetical protein CSA26_06525 [Desulfobacterales bacterium]|nr:MAG: hypothetical protein CSA26_06525 [Desulfobacterales bacterium]